MWILETGTGWSRPIIGRQLWRTVADNFQCNACQTPNIIIQCNHDGHSKGTGKHCTQYTLFLHTDTRLRVRFSHSVTKMWYFSNMAHCEPGSKIGQNTVLILLCWNNFDRIKTVEGLDQRYMLIPADVKDAYLVHTIDKYKEENPRSSIMVFVQTCK